MDRFIDFMSKCTKTIYLDLKSNMDRFIVKGHCCVWVDYAFKIQYG